MKSAWKTSPIQLSELLDPTPSALWYLVKQCGVDNVVGLLDGGEQHQRWLRLGGDHPEKSTSNHEPWSFQAIKQIQDDFARYGLNVVALEDTPPMDSIRLGLPDTDLVLEQVHEQIRTMGELGIPVLCYNWMTFSSWSRTAVDIPTRGGALTTGFKLSEANKENPLNSSLDLSPELLWNTLDAFLEATLPVAEKAGVKLSLHPDDPPLPEVRGVPRIVSSLQAYRRILESHPSPSNCITFCQGNFRLMTDDLENAIQEFLPNIAFVHFRDVMGTAEDFHETFHDAGPTDLADCMNLYVKYGFSGPMRPDHVQTLYGETNNRPGYETLGRLFALGYIRGLQHANQFHLGDR